MVKIYRESKRRFETEVRPVDSDWFETHKIVKVPQGDWDEFKSGDAVIAVENECGTEYGLAGTQETYWEIEGTFEDRGLALKGDEDSTSHTWAQHGVGVELMEEEGGYTYERGLDSGEGEPMELIDWSDVRLSDAEIKEREAADVLFELFEESEGERRTRAQEALHKLGWHVEKHYVLVEDN